MSTNIAATLRTSADTYHKQTAAKRLAMCDDYVNNTILPILNEAANAGRYHKDIDMPTDHSRDTIVQILNNHGLSIYQYPGHNAIRVSW